MSLGTKIKIRFVVPTLLAGVLSLWMTDKVAANAVAGKGAQPVSAAPAVIPAPATTVPSAPVPVFTPAPAAAPIAITPPAPVAVSPAVVMPPASAPVAAKDPAPAAAKKTSPAALLLIKTGNHGDFARAVFNCPQPLVYHIIAAGDVLHITLETKSDAKIMAAKTPLIKKITAVPQADGVLNVDIATAAGATYKDSRFQNKIIVDIYAAAPAQNKNKAAAPPKKAELPVKTVVKSAEEKKPLENKPSSTPISLIPGKPSAPAPKAVAMPVVPVDTSPVLSDPEAIADARLPGKPAAALPEWNLSITKPDGGAPVEQKPAQPSQSSSDDERTATITLSSLSPMRVAVFERFDALWIVTDATGTDADLPAISGKMEDFIPPPKVLKFKQGTAYRYTLPQKFYLRVTKQSLSWQVDLLPNPPPAATASLSVEPHVQFDQKTKAAILVAYMKGAGDPLSFEDPEIGDMLYVVPTNKPDQAAQEERYMMDLEVIPAAAGMVIRPLKDGLIVQHIMLTADQGLDGSKQKEVKKTGSDVGQPLNYKEEVKSDANKPQNDVIIVTAPFGLSVTPEGGGVVTLIGAPDEASDDDNNRLFDFPNWRRGGSNELQKNRQELQEKIAAAETPEARAGLLMDLAKLFFANNFGQEALGVLNLALIENPDMEKNPDFIALRGAANAMSGHFKEALQDLSFPAIQQHPEVNLWVGFAAAATEQWHMADRSFPKSNRLLLQYPDNIAIPFTIYMAESALHLGHTDMANKLLDSINESSDALGPQYKAAIGYLRGVAFSQMGQPEKAAALWQPVADGLDRLYHTKASLSLTRLQLQQKKITLKQAIDQVDSLRFAWRGDGLEVNILHTLGALKVQDGQILSGLEDMKQAADLSDSLQDDSTPIRDDMKHIFTDLFMSDPGSKVKPLEVVSVYNEFSSLIPPGPEATTAALNFTDSLISMDLLGKAAALMEDQLKSGNLPEDKSAALGVKLTAVYLLDSKPKQALAALTETEKSDLPPRIQEERTLLRARAQSQLGQTSDAIATLSKLNSKNALRLKADVLWRAQKWGDAAAAIEALLPDLTKPLTDEDASYVVNAAVALKLAGNMDKLKEIKTKYESPMAATKLASTFDVVTRDGGSSVLGDRETMLKIAGEVDMFKGFLENYKAGLGSGS